MIFQIRYTKICMVLCFPTFLFGMEQRTRPAEKTKNEAVIVKVAPLAKKTSKANGETVKQPAAAKKVSKSALKVKVKPGATAQKPNTHEKVKGVNAKITTKAKMLPQDESTDELIIAPAKDVAKSPYPKAYYNRDIAGVLKRLIMQETKGIWGAIYRCNDPVFIKAWGGKVSKLSGCLMLSRNSENEAEDRKEQLALAKFEEFGLPIRRVNTLQENLHSEMHNKFLIFECNEFGKPLVATGSSNATTAAFTYHFEDIVVSDDPNVIAYYVAELHEMFIQSKPDNKHAHAIKELALRFQPVSKIDKKFPPVSFRSAIKEVVKNLIAWETGSIDGAQFVFIWNEAAELWGQKKIGGSLMLDMRYEEDNATSMLYCLQQGGVKLFVIKKKYYPSSDRFVCMHHKFLIFNNNIYKKPVILVGSVNMSDKSLDENWENALVSEDNSLIQQFRGKLNSMITDKAAKAIPDLEKQPSPFLD